MATATVLASISLGLNVVGQLSARGQSKKAQAAAERAEQARQKSQDAQAQRQRRQQVREARVKRANILAGAEAAGTGQTSSLVTGAGSVGSQLGTNISFLDRIQGFNKQAGAFNVAASAFTSRAATFESLGKFGATAVPVVADFIKGFNTTPTVTTSRPTGTGVSPGFSFITG